MIGSTVPVRISRCHLRMWSAHETGGRTAKPASETDDPISSAHQSWPLDWPGCVFTCFLRAEGPLLYRDLLFSLNIILIEIWVKCIKNNECMLPKKRCGGVIFDLVSLKMCERNLDISMSTAGFFTAHISAPWCSQRGKLHRKNIRCSIR